MQNNVLAILCNNKDLYVNCLPFLRHEKQEAVQNTPKSDNLLKRRIHDAENTSIMQIIVIRCVICPQLSRISDLSVFLRCGIYLQLNILYDAIHFQAYQMKFMHSLVLLPYHTTLKYLQIQFVMLFYKRKFEENCIPVT